MHYATEIKRCGYKSVIACVPNDWTNQQVLDYVKEEAWGRSGWKVRDPDTRLVCFQRQGFVHILVDYSLTEEKNKDEVMATEKDK